MIKVIHEVDVALRSLIEREATDGTEVEVVFDAPTKDWASRRNTPTIDVYLYDIREDLRRRERGLINEYDEQDRITARHLPPRHFKLSYLVTAWTQRPEDEHRLLSALLSCFLRHDAIPADLLTGPLAELGLPLPVTIALPPPEDRSFADVWSALGGELKPSLDVVVTAPTDTGQHYAAAPLVTAPHRIGIGGRRVVAARGVPAEAERLRRRPAGRGGAAGSGIDSPPPAKLRPGRPGVDAGRDQPAVSGAVSWCAGGNRPESAPPLRRVGLVEDRIRALVLHRRADDPAPDDPFRGLYVTDEVVDQLLDAGARTRSRTGRALRAAEAEADVAAAAGASLRLRQLPRRRG